MFRLALLLNEGQSHSHIGEVCEGNVSRSAKLEDIEVTNICDASYHQRILNPYKLFIQA